VLSINDNKLISTIDGTTVHSRHRCARRTLTELIRHLARSIARADVCACTRAWKQTNCVAETVHAWNQSSQAVGHVKPTNHILSMQYCHDRAEITKDRMTVGVVPQVCRCQDDDERACQQWAKTSRD
jgi:hypothetical protein